MNKPVYKGITTNKSFIGSEQKFIKSCNATPQTAISKFWSNTPVYEGVFNRDSINKTFLANKWFSWVSQQANKAESKKSFESNVIKVLLKAKEHNVFIPKRFLNIVDRYQSDIKPKVQK